MKIINPFTDIQAVPIDESIPENYSNNILNKLRIGGGSNVLNFEKGKGFWAGGQDFETAPFKVHMNGEVEGVDGAANFKAGFDSRAGGIDDTLTGSQTIEVGFEPTTVEIDAFYAPGLSSYSGAWSNGLWTDDNQECFHGVSSQKDRDLSNIIRIDRTISGKVNEARLTSTTETGFILNWSSFYYEYDTYFFWKAWKE